MSDRAHRRQPATLPEGYQYGDARPEPINPEGATFVHEGVTYVIGPPLTFNPDAFALVWEGETCAICGGAASWDSGIDRWRCRKCGARWISGIAMKPISDEEYKEKYLRPAVEHDPQGAAELADRWRALHENAAEQLKRQAEVIEVGIVGTPKTDEEKKAVALAMQVLPSIQAMLNDKELKAKVDKMYYDGASLRDAPGLDWFMPADLRCPQCGQPPDIFHRRTRAATDAQGRTHLVCEPIAYCPSAFHFDPPQRTGDETV